MLSQAFLLQQAGTERTTEQTAIDNAASSTEVGRLIKQKNYSVVFGRSETSCLKTFYRRRQFQSPGVDLITFQNHIPTQQMMVVPRHRLSTIGHRAFAVQGPTVRNFLLDDLRAQQDYESFRQHPRTWLFSSYQHAQHIRDFVTIALHKFTFTITITTAPSCYFRSLVHLLLLCQFVPFSEHIGLNYITAVTRNSNEHAKYYLWF